MLRRRGSDGLSLVRYSAGLVSSDQEGQAFMFHRCGCWRPNQGTERVPERKGCPELDTRHTCLRTVL